MDQENSQPVTSIEFNTLPVDAEERYFDSSVVQVHRHVLTQIHQAQKKLLTVKSLSTLVKYLLEDFPSVFAAPQAELWLHDPEGRLAALAPISALFGRHLRFEFDSGELYELYSERPSVSILSLEDERMFAVLPSAGTAVGCIMLPLFDGNRLIGSYHLAISEDMHAVGEEDRQLLQMFSALCASALLRVVEFQHSDRYSLLDPLTELGNLRAFRRNVLRECSWARRTRQSLALLSIAIDGLEELSQVHGESSSRFVLRKVSQRICSMLRATDYIAHMRLGEFSVLLPHCGEPDAHTIAERFRLDLDQLALEDENGAVLYATLSVGMVCWNPVAHPVASTETLGKQLESEAESAMRRAEKAGGNQVSVARLGALML